MKVSKKSIPVFKQSSECSLQFLPVTWRFYGTKSGIRMRQG